MLNSCAEGFAARILRWARFLRFVVERKWVCELGHVMALPAGYCVSFEPGKTW